MSKLIFGSNFLSVGLSLCIFPKLPPLKYHLKVFKYLSFFLHVRNKTNVTLIVKKNSKKKVAVQHIFIFKYASCRCNQ